jgi:melanoma-associated antigen
VEDEAAYVAFYTVLISLIRLNGGEMSDSRLKRYLRRLNAETNSFHSTKTEDTLSRLQRQGYLIKNIDKEARQHGDEQEATTWYVGPRGKVEVGDEVVAGVVREVWGKQEDDELEAKLQNSLQIQNKKASVQNMDAASEGASDDGNEGASGANGEGPSRRSGRRRQLRQDQDEEG